MSSIAGPPVVSAIDVARAAREVAEAAHKALEEAKSRAKLASLPVVGDERRFPENLADDPAALAKALQNELKRAMRVRRNFELMRSRKTCATVRAALVMFLLALSSLGAEAEGRFALLIGNQNYNGNVGPLKNPHNDIALVGNALERLGFKLTIIRGAGYRALDTALRVHIQTVRCAGRNTITIIRAMAPLIPIQGSTT